MFEGSYRTADTDGDPGLRLECGVCWYVYDPAQGDAVRQVPPGTPFSLLPESWACPQCDAPRHKFMVLSD